ncbi:MAG: hypothetical protein M3088_03305, partial [Actinomycetota bacterium]|nr:hypothetical protein [Actinomycetota bacterium]
LALVARHATGSFRDALGTLEQLVTYGGARIELADVLEVLGVADAELVFEAAEALADHDSKAALLAVERLAASGRELAQFIRDLAAHLRHLFVAQTLGEVPETFSVTAEYTDRIAAQAERIPQGDLLRAIDLLAAALAAIKDGSEPRIQLELALMKATKPDADLSLGALAFRVEQLENRLAAVGGPADGAQSRPASSSPNGAASERTVAASARPSTEGAVTVTSPAGDPAGTPAQAPPVAEPTPSAVAAAEGAPPAANPSPSAVAAALQSSPQALDLAALRTLWPSVVDAVRGENAMVGALLAEARPAELEGERLTVALAPGADFARRKIEANRPLVQTALRRLTGGALTLSLELSDGNPEDGATASPQMLTEDELLERLKQELGAREIFDDDPPKPEE